MAEKQTLQQVRFREHEGIELGAHIGGPEKGHPVVLLHEAWGCTNSTLAFGLELANRNCRVFIPEYFRGQTASTTQERDRMLQRFNSSITTIVENTIQGAMQHLGGRCHLVGSGFGGSLALRAQQVLKSVRTVSTIYSLPWSERWCFDRVNVPLLIIRGSYDEWITEATVKSVLKVSPDTSRDIVLHGQHGFLNEEQGNFIHAHRAKVAEHVAGWLGSIGSA
jgi:pimeloyl-ACP methyl ester carboxylesterase